MVSPNYRPTNNLSTQTISVWSNLTPGISPSSWAFLCRQIDNLSPSEFTTIQTLLTAHTSLKNAVKRQVRGILGIDGLSNNIPNSHLENSDSPIVSIGSSGINGEFQKEI
jgi:hypothetical protein